MKRDLFPHKRYRLRILNYLDVSKTTLPRSGAFLYVTKKEDWVLACRWPRCYFAENLDIIFLYYSGFLEVDVVNLLKHLHLK